VEPLEASVRILGGILRGVSGLFGGGGHRDRKEEEAREPRRGTSEPIDRLERELERLRDSWSRGDSERKR
jgi:hypothetical protein